MGWKDKFSGLMAGTFLGGRGSFLADASDDQVRYSDENDVYYEPTSRKSGAGIRITPEAAMRLSAFFACAKVLAETIASLPFQVNRRLAGGGSAPAPSHPLDELIRYQPNKIQTAVEFWESIILHAVLHGTGYAEIVPGTRGAVDQLIFIRSDRITQDSLADGTLRFTVSNPHNGRTKVLLQSEVLRIPGLSLDGINGLRIVDMAAEAIGLGLAADQYATRVFSNNLNIGGYLTSPKKMSGDAVRRLVGKLMEKFATPGGFHRPVVLQDGVTFKEGAMKASEAQLLEARKWQISEIARFLRIPLHMLGVDDQTNRSTVEEQGINFVKYVVRPWARRIEQAVRRDLIIATGLYEVKFNLDALERGNLAARKDYWGAALGEGGNRPGWMCVNEVRIAEGLNAIDEDWAWEVPRGLAAPVQQPAAAQVEPKEEPKEDAVAIPAPAVAIEDRTPEAIAKKVAGKEISTLRGASMRFAADPDGLRSYINAFYGGHVSFVMENLEIPKEGAKAYCRHQRDEAIAANDFVGLLDRWDDTLAAVITAKLKERGD